MPTAEKKIELIITDDDEADYALVKSALDQVGVRGELIWAKDGEQLIELLQRRGAYATRPEPRCPRLIILDLNMPGMGGHQALEIIKADPALRRIPIIIMTTSGNAEDVDRSYDRGACSFIRKPAEFADLVRIAKEIKRYWLEMVELPPVRWSP